MEANTSDQSPAPGAGDQDDGAIGGKGMSEISEPATRLQGIFIAETAASTGEIEKALRTFVKVHAISQIRSLGSRLFRDGQFQKAVQVFEEVGIFIPRDLLLVCGKVATQRKDFQSAISAFTRANDRHELLKCAVACDAAGQSNFARLAKDEADSLSNSRDEGRTGRGAGKEQSA